MITLIVKYKEQKWDGNNYQDITRSGIIRFRKLESVSQQEIEDHFDTRHIIEITQLHD